MLQVSTVIEDRYLGQRNAEHACHQNRANVRII
jgi:hypothetical protein